MTQVRKSKSQHQSELKTIWLEIACGLPSDQIIKKEKLTDRQFSSYLRSLKKQAEKRFSKLGAEDLAFTSELYLHRMNNLSNSLTIMIAKSCTNKDDEDDILDSHLFEVQRNILNDIQNHEERRIGTAMGMKWAEEKVKQSKKEKDIPITKDNSHMGVS